MLQLKNIVKNYTMGDTTVEALKGVSLDFRDSEFVSILGPSGCGKTTMLNIIGGLDRYTSGDLVINSVSTKKYKDADWDIYRNNSIGFVFQSYNLIPHQTVLSNVELAMTLAGKSRSERRKRAVEILESVGLGDQLNKKPTQMSGGQMQRVAIARALVNNPDILLADEPTGALDSETSIQIMNLLKEIAQDRLVIMVTHNADIAERYSTRVIRLLDGRVTGDTAPFEPTPETSEAKRKSKKISMSLPTALSLSFRNLMTKKTRTLLTAFAGSIGIIGIALIMSLSSGMQDYVNNLERDTLSTYPIQLEKTSIDMTGMMMSMMGRNRSDDSETREPDKVYSNNILTDMASAFTSQVSKNNLALFMEYLEGDDGQRLREVTNSIRYGYDVDLQIYNADTSGTVLRVNPSDVMAKLNMRSELESNMPAISASAMSGENVWDQLLDNRKLLNSQYDVVAGRWPSAYDEVVIVVSEHNELSDAVLYSLGLLDPDEVDEILKKVFAGESVEKPEGSRSFSYDELLSLTFKLVLNTDYFVKEDGKWLDKRDDAEFMKKLVDSSADIKVVGILRPSEQAAATSFSGTVGYLSSLTDFVINAIGQTEIASEQLASPETNVFTGISFDVDEYLEHITIEDVYDFAEDLPAEEQAQMQTMFATMTEEQILTFMSGVIRANSGETATYEDNLATLGIVDMNNPGIISLYPKDFDSKEEITALIAEYNQAQEDAGHSENVINYTDIVGIMTSSISNIINIVSYVLIAFVAISLVVSSIMIAIITYISVLERTKEIGILRSIGASKKDISRVFNAETIIEGFVAGTIGILITLLLNIPINAIIYSLVDISGISELPLSGAIGLIILSVVLTVAAGLVPSKIAARKDPVEALRSE